MPYTIQKGSGSKPYKIVKKTTGEVVGSSTSKEKAKASIVARMIGESSRRISKK